jgi:hypothetical protein
VCMCVCVCGVCECECVCVVRVCGGCVNASKHVWPENTLDDLFCPKLGVTRVTIEPVQICHDADSRSAQKPDG